MRRRISDMVRGFDNRGVGYGAEEMNISLDQAIEIHAEVLRRQHNRRAPDWAREWAVEMKSLGDHEGHAVWLRVAECAELLLSEIQEPFSAETAPN